MPRKIRTDRRPGEEPDVLTGVLSYSWTDGTGGGHLSGSRGYPDPFTARAHWPEWRSRVWAAWEARPYPPAAAMHHDGLGRRLQPLLVTIPGAGIDADELAEAAAKDLSTLDTYEAPPDIAEPIEAYRRQLVSFVVWVAGERGRIPMDVLAFEKPWASMIRSRRVE